MHVLIRKCRAEMARTSDPEPVLTVIDRFTPDTPTTDERLRLAADLMARAHFHPAETVLWQILRLPGRRFPTSAHLSAVRALAAAFPKKTYTPSHRLASLSVLLNDLSHRVRGLFRHGESVPRSLVRRLLAPPAPVAELVRIAETRSLYPKDSPGSGWVPIHALRVLGRLRAPEAVAPLFRGMTDPEIFDYAMQELPFALGQIGAPALEPAVRVLERTPGLDEFQIITTLRVLRDIAILDETCRPRVSRFLLGRARDEDQPPEVRGFCLRYLIEMEAEELREAVESSLEAPFFDRGVTISAERLRRELREMGSGRLQERRYALQSRFKSLYGVE